MSKLSKERIEEIKDTLKSPFHDLIDTGDNNMKEDCLAYIEELESNQRGSYIDKPLPYNYGCMSKETYERIKNEVKGIREYSDALLKLIDINKFMISEMTRASCFRPDDYDMRSRTLSSLESELVDLENELKGDVSE